jgi:hypothetical protein
MRKAWCANRDTIKGIEKTPLPGSKKGAFSVPLENTNSCWQVQVAQREDQRTRPEEAEKLSLYVHVLLSEERGKLNKTLRI